jgi:hypothetical protein
MTQTINSPVNVNAYYFAGRDMKTFPRQIEDRKSQAIRHEQRRRTYLPFAASRRQLDTTWHSHGGILMKRTYLEEDVRLIQKYFPGARQTTIRTPFDLTDRPLQPKQALTDALHDTPQRLHWLGDTIWTH